MRPAVAHFQVLTGEVETEEGQPAEQEGTAHNPESLGNPLVGPQDSPLVLDHAVIFAEMHSERRLQRLELEVSLQLFFVRF